MMRHFLDTEPLEADAWQVLGSVGAPGVITVRVGTRGFDLSVDEAESMRNALDAAIVGTTKVGNPFPPPRFTTIVSELYERLATIYAEHPPHSVGGNVCGGTTPTDRCDRLGLMFQEAMGDAIPEDLVIVRGLLRGTTAAWAWTDADEDKTVAEYAAGAFRAEAWQRILPNYALIPIKPSDG